MRRGEKVKRSTFACFSLLFLLPPSPSSLPIPPSLPSSLRSSLKPKMSNRRICESPRFCSTVLRKSFVDFVPFRSRLDPASSPVLVLDAYDLSSEEQVNILNVLLSDPNLSHHVRRVHDMVVEAPPHELQLFVPSRVLDFLAPILTSSWSLVLTFQL